MRGKPFFDSNILIYAVIQETHYSEIARALLEEGGSISVQSLNEFISVGRRKLKLDWEELRDATEAIVTLCPKPIAITLDIHRAGLEIAVRFGYTIYDSLIIAAALASRCSILYSQDMQDGQAIESVTIRNPFRPPKPTPVI